MERLRATIRIALRGLLSALQLGAAAVELPELSAVIADLRQDRDSWREQTPTVGLVRSETSSCPMFRLVPLPLIPVIANISQTLREFHETLGILSNSVLAAMVAQLRM